MGEYGGDTAAWGKGSFVRDDRNALLQEMVLIPLISRFELPLHCACESDTV